MGLDRLWAGWRTTYIAGLAENAPDPTGDGGGSLFERIYNSGLADEQTHILWRDDHAFALLNAYPYTSGHLLVLPRRAVAELENLSEEEAASVWHGVRLGVVAIKAAYRPQGVNVGMNLGRASGAGVPDHLHVHCLPRWAGDTNFMTTVAEARVLPEPLDETWVKLTAAWPDRRANR